MPPKRAAASKRKAAALEDDAPASPAAASRSAKKQGGSKGAKAARKSKDADAEDEQDAAEMADAAPSSSSSAAAASAPAPKLKGKAAKLAAALAASPPSPINRCDADSISVVFSFLNTREFLAAIAVSRAFHAARLKHTAWPKLNLSSFIQSLRDDNYSDNARRRLDMSFDVGTDHKLRLGSVALGRGLEQVRAEAQRVSEVRRDHRAAVVEAAKEGAPLPELSADLHHMLTTPAAAGAADSCSSMWRHVTDLRLRVSNYFLWGDGVCDLEVALHHLTLFPYASAINISAGCPEFFDTPDNARAPSAESVRQMYERLAQAQRVEAMLLFRIPRPFLDGLPLLSSTLKVLVLDRQPPASILCALVHLVYFHFESGTLGLTFSVADAHAASAELGMALRWLSVNHALRSLSVAKNNPSFYRAGLNFVIVPPFIAGATPEQGGPAGEAQSNVALAAAKAEIARSADSTLPRVDWSKPCGLTDITLTGDVSPFQLCCVSRLPLLRLELGPGPAPRQAPLDPNQVVQPVSCFADLQVLRLEMDGRGCSGFSMDTLRQCNKLRVLQLSCIEPPRWCSWGKMPQTALSSMLRSNAETLEELRVGANYPVAWDAPEPQWALGRSTVATAAAASSSSAVSSESSMPDAAGETAAVVPAAAVVAAPSDLPALAACEWPSVLLCTRLHVVELVNQSIPPSFVAALACLPAFHTLELINTAAQFSLPSNLAACVSHSRSWTNVCLSLQKSPGLNLLRASGGLSKLLPADDLSEAAVQRLRVYGFKDEQRQVLAVQIDKKGARRWASIEGPFATAVI